MNPMDRINAALAKPVSHVAIVAYSDGSEQRVDCRSAQAAEAFLSSYRPLIGIHEYVSRSSGNKITIASCEVKVL